MQIPRSYVQNYSKALNAVSGQARSALENALMRIDYSADVSLVRSAVVAVMQRYCGASATLSARLAADFYNGLRLWCGIDDGFEASVQTTRSPAATEGAVRAFAQDLVDQKPVEQFVGKCVDRLDYETRLSANRCIESNARRDPRRPKWARVPTGPETCEFCMMLASRGFAYHTEDTASHAHAHCDCRIVPGWDGVTSVEGYDPGYYYDVYRHPERHQEVREAINARRRERRAERREAEGSAKASNSLSDTASQRLEHSRQIATKVYDMSREDVAFQAQLINGELANAWTRTPNISNDAKAYRNSYGVLIERLATNASIHVEDFTKVRGKEAQLARWLSKAGIELTLRNPDTHQSVDGNTSDVQMRGLTFDFKRVESKNISRMVKLVTEKLGEQGPGFVIDLSVSEMNADQALRRCAQLLDDPQIEEIIVVKGGKMTLLEKRPDVSRGPTSWTSGV